MIEQMLHSLRRFTSYLFSKRSEVADLDVKDAVLAKTVLDIHRKRTHSSFTYVPLFHIQPIHVIDRQQALEVTKQRAGLLASVREELCRHRRLSRELLASHLPSVSGIKVVRQSPERVIAYEGNGRLAALQQVFSSDDGIEVEVEEYHFARPEKILRRINRVRRLNGLE